MGLTDVQQAQGHLRRLRSAVCGRAARSPVPRFELPARRFELPAPRFEFLALRIEFRVMRNLRSFA
jgi:hypothetical protein